MNMFFAICWQKSVQIFPPKQKYERALLARQTCEWFLSVRRTQSHWGIQLCKCGALYSIYHLYTIYFKCYYVLIEFLWFLFLHIYICLSNKNDDAAISRNLKTITCTRGFKSTAVCLIASKGVAKCFFCCFSVQIFNWVL